MKLTVRTVLVWTIALVIFFAVAFKLKHMYWDDADKQPLPTQVWINPNLVPAPKQAESAPNPAVPQDGKWVKSNEVEKTSDGKPIQRWTCDRKGATEPITIWGLVADYNVKGTDPIIAEFQSYKGVKTSVFFNPATGERKLNSATGQKLDDAKYGEIGKTAKSVRFLPGIQDGFVSVEVITHR